MPNYHPDYPQDNEIQTLSLEKSEEEEQGSSPGAVGVGETVVAGVVAEVLDGDPTGESVQVEAAFDDALRQGIGGSGFSELRRGVLGEEIEGSDQLLSVGRREGH